MYARAPVTEAAATYVGVLFALIRHQKDLQNGELFFFVRFRMWFSMLFIRSIFGRSMRLTVMCQWCGIGILDISFLLPMLFCFDSASHLWCVFVCLSVCVRLSQQCERASVVGDTVCVIPFTIHEHTIAPHFAWIACTWTKKLSLFFPMAKERKSSKRRLCRECARACLGLAECIR